MVRLSGCRRRRGSAKSVVILNVQELDQVGQGLVDAGQTFGGKVLETLAQGDASVAWCVGQGSGLSMSSAYVIPEVARTMIGHCRAVLASGPNNPKATMVVCDGGYRVTGEWGFASGYKHAAWMCGHGTICTADGEPQLGPDSKPLELVTVLFPKSSVTIIDVWNVMGLKGTGSDNYCKNYGA